MRVQFHTLGCRLNEAEVERWAAQFQRRGVALAGADEGADLVVVNTCAVTQEAVRKSRHLLRRARRVNPAARLVVSGCYATLEPGALADLAEVDLLVTNRDKDRLVELALARLDLAGAAPTPADVAAPLFARGRQRAFVKVQDGCRHRCTFCIVNVARGAERSRPIAEVCAEVAGLVAAGVHEVVLTGVHLGGYADAGGGDLADLVRALLAETAVARLRIGALEPWDLPDGLWGLFADPRLMPHLHLPLQSGSDRVLRRMARRGTTGDYARLVAAARAAVPDFVVTTDIIAGFPGEDAADWAATMDFVARVGFGDLHVFAYSPRAGTPAAGWPGQVDAAVRQARCRELGVLARALRAATLCRFVGRRVAVLVEARGPAAIPGHWSGYTPSYLPVRVAAGGAPVPVNRVVEVALVGITDEGAALVGEARP
ncbi:tRNA (N(6)-L-threonylcarbamoyladenosine(37)-C(2))-methylthiotransferase MtaB [Thiococcus pfennigii]|jgi:threonylcarbamoyladenosine tRNA methylthiotransferase MtaB|uniref:tRNA (N(6)-L-threonylcarbamoyladenosine(37)-C(2))- methylthiotransferase MtaB n=2 Tax=Thiococcus pfennigii TaxID=1057 RepID=UPI001903C210|nr:tRNA (N(6)-L-threonylcarbamoyladenosine(37)-C(2))-methylthiotransferase MtaB [Thiococcus pfennigii]MBK1730671.1 tRNA (N(6)-L-threonylcarbamoyladenosine(37)-C(2))-methylthiotransferase MtaB [Thiococcus pfennigii]